MGRDKADGKDVQEQKETKEARGEFSEKAAEQAHGKDNLATLQAEKVNKFADGKIDKVDKVVGEKVSPAERAAAKELAHAIASGDMKEVGKVLKDLSQQKPPVDMKRVGYVLDKALGDTGIRVEYDGNKGDGMVPHIRIETGPLNDDRRSSNFGRAELGADKNKAVMIPVDGGTPQTGRGGTYYVRTDRPTRDDAGPNELADAAKRLKESQINDEKRKQVAGLK